MSFFQWGIDLRRRKPKVGALCVILHPVCVSSRCEDENLPQPTDRNSAAVAAVQKGGICTVRSWLFLSNLNLWVLQLLFLELLDFRIPAHTYCQSWGWEQGLHIWFRMSPSLWQCDIRNERCSCCLASLSRAEQGRWCIEILWCWPRQWQHWVPVIMLGSANFLFFTSVRGRAELGQRWECSSGALDMVLADAWMGIAVQSGLFYKHEFQKWKMTEFYAWTLLRLFICIFSLVCPVRFCVFDVKSLWDVWGKTWEYSKVVYFEQQMHPK